MLIKCDNLIEIINADQKVEIRVQINEQNQELVQSLLQQYAGNIEEHNKSVDMNALMAQENVDWTESLIRNA